MDEIEEKLREREIAESLTEIGEILGKIAEILERIC